MLSFCLLAVSVYIYQLTNASMIVQSCVKDIIVTNLATRDTGNPYPTDNTFTIQIVVDSESPMVTPTPTTLSGGSASFSDEICFDFDSSTFSPIISYNPVRGRQITFNIMGDGDTFGRVTTLFPDSTFGSNKTAFVTDTLSVEPTSTFDGTITFSIYHQIQTSNTYLKIANRNFNVYRQCFEMKRLCIYEGGIENPTYPNDCITELTTSHIELVPNDNSATDEIYLLDNVDTHQWISTPTPTPSKPKATNMAMGKCWAPYSQYIIINLHDISGSVGAISAISLGFTADPSMKHSGDTTEIPPRWITFAFDSNRANLVSDTSDVDTNQYWAVDLQGGNFKSEGSSDADQFVWTVNPLHFQYDTKPAANAFRMTQITHGFGLQYLVNTTLEYQSEARYQWDIYAAAYIESDQVNTGTAGPYTNQVKQLAEIACKNIFPQSSPNYVESWDQSNTYSACWGYSPNITYECYDTTAFLHDNPDGEVFVPPVAFLIRRNIPVGPEFTCCFPETSPYCIFGNDTWPLRASKLKYINDWSECNATRRDDSNYQQKCMLEPWNCHDDTLTMQAIPMGWRCLVPMTPEPTRMPTRNPTTPTDSPTLNPTNMPTFIPTNTPTLNPTTVPTTSAPTFNPTYIPTSIPTNIPTSLPTEMPTGIPTNDPTFEPTYYPSAQPSLSPTLRPSIPPTKSPGASGQAGDHETTEQGTEGKTGNAEKDDGNWLWWLIIILFVLFVLFVGGIMVGVVFYKRKKNAKINDSMRQNVEMRIISTSNDKTPMVVEIINTESKRKDSLDEMYTTVETQGGTNKALDAINTNDEIDEIDEMYTNVETDENNTDVDEITRGETEGMDDMENENVEDIGNKKIYTLPLKITFTKPNILHPNDEKETENSQNIYCVVFEKKPLGLTLGKVKTDKKNLFVTGVDEGGVAEKANVIVGSKIIKFEDEEVEGLGFMKIFQTFADKYSDKIPLKITFSYDKD